MTPYFTKSLSSRIEEELRQQQFNNSQALEMDAEFHVLKKIKSKIKKLEEHLKIQKGIKSIIEKP